MRHAVREDVNQCDGEVIGVAIALPIATQGEVSEDEWITSFCMPM
jgi:hypothetical protein